MNERLENQMECSEYSLTLRIMSEDASHYKNYLEFSTPTNSRSHAYSSNIASQVASILELDGFYTNGFTGKSMDGSRNDVQYFSKEGIEIFNIITEDLNLFSTNLDFKIEGDRDMVKVYRHALAGIIESIMDDKKIDDSEMYSDLPF